MFIVFGYWEGIIQAITGLAVSKLLVIEARKNWLYRHINVSYLPVVNRAGAVVVDRPHWSAAPMGPVY